MPFDGSRPSPITSSQPVIRWAFGARLAAPCCKPSSTRPGYVAGASMGHPILRPKSPDPTAGCGKPHVRWCGRGDGRNPVTPTRFLNISLLFPPRRVTAINLRKSRPENEEANRKAEPMLRYSMVQFLLYSYYTTD
jgi:hypothetical protein